MSARDELRRYVSLLGDMWTPRATTDARVERLYQQVRTDVLREAADVIASSVPPASAGPYTEDDRRRAFAARELRRMADEVTR